MTARSTDEIRADLAQYSIAAIRLMRSAPNAATRLAADVVELLESRERAIRWAVTLENQNAEALALHKPTAWDRIPASACDDPKGHADRWFDDPWDSFCAACAETARYCAECTRVAINVDGDAECVNWPCPTVAALTGSTE